MATETNKYEHMPTLRVIEILEVVASSSSGLTLSRIAQLLKYPKSTLTPILKTLVNHNYLSCNPDTLVYDIGRRSFILGNTYNESGTILELIKEQMLDIVAACGETCHLGILLGKDIMYLQKVNGTRPIQLIKCEPHTRDFSHELGEQTSQRT